MIYLDSAATTLQKPACVANAANWAIRHAASPGRGGHSAAMRAAKIVYSCREAAANMFRLSDPSHVVITFNATHALNIAIKTLVTQGKTVLISGYEHNAVTRPLNAIPNVCVKIAEGTLFHPEEVLQSFKEELQKGVDVAVCTHVSNVYGFILPIEEIAALCCRYQTPLIIDASQSAGVLPIDMLKLKAAFIAMPGHKGLYGPQGTGILLCAQEYSRTLMEGGTGSNSLEQVMPEFLPDRLEAGTHNVPGIAGLLQGLRFVEKRGVAAIAEHERNLLYQLNCKLKQYSNVELFYAQDPLRQSGVLSMRLRNHDCEEVGEWLSQHKIAVRPGLHCAPLAHRSGGTLETGTVRISVSAFNQMCEIQRFLYCMQPLLK